jgi:Uma2 family endonuclease
MQMTTTLWEEILANPRFADLPYKVETTEHGQIVLSPQKPRHGRLQSLLSNVLAQHLDHGATAVEFAVETPKGVKVPDVVWMSDERWEAFPEDAAASPVMPEIVVEVLSVSNTAAEMEEKRRLYFTGGAQEVWIVTPEGDITFYGPGGLHESSQLVPTFPRRLR